MRAGTLEDNILVFLATSGTIAKKALHAPFSKYNARYYSTAYCSLLKDGYIEENKTNRRLMTRLTRKGTAIVRENHPERNIAPIPASKDYMRKRRQQMLSGAAAVLSASGIIVSGAFKPDMMALKRGMDESSADNSQEVKKFKRAVKGGLFINSTELKALCRETDGSSDYLYAARLLGVILFQGRVLYVYNLADKVIELFPKREQKTIDAIEKVLSQISCICDAVKFRDSRSCILLSTSKAMLAKVYLSKTERTGKKGEKERLERWTAVHATYPTLSMLFDKIYYASCDANGAKMIRDVKRLSVVDPCNALLKRLGCKEDGNCYYMAFEPNLGGVIIPMPVIDICELDAYVKECISTQQQVILYAHKYYADVLSRCFGPCLHEFRDSESLEPVDVYRYDSSGNPVGDSYMEALKYNTHKEAGHFETRGK